ERRAQATPELMAKLERAGNDALGVMEVRLAAADWLAGDDFSIADMALYAYTHMAGEGGFDIAAFPSVTAWLARIAALPGHVTIDWRPA
ncbi:MAG TPA: glutathione binding-like protein, partial [Afifellaceae bacterium]|nr:glutathione binding-like protein [Afifellaceae bacterium]